MIKVQTDIGKIIIPDISNRVLNNTTTPISNQIHIDILNNILNVLKIDIDRITIAVDLQHLIEDQFYDPAAQNKIADKKINEFRSQETEVIDQWGQVEMVEEDILNNK